VKGEKASKKSGKSREKMVFGWRGWEKKKKGKLCRILFNYLLNRGRGTRKESRPYSRKAVPAKEGKKGVDQKMRRLKGGKGAGSWCVEWRLRGCHVAFVLIREKLPFSFCSL